MLNLLTRRPANTPYYVKGRCGYFQHRNGGIPVFLPHDARHLAPKFSLKQAEELAAKCKAAGHDVDVSTV